MYEKRINAEKQNTYNALTAAQKDFVNWYGSHSNAYSREKPVESALVDKLEKSLRQGKKPSEFFKENCEWLFNGYPGDFNRLAESVNSVKSILSSLLSNVQEASMSVQNGSSQLASAADSLSQGSVVQANSIQSLTLDIENMTVATSTELSNQADGLTALVKRFIV